jgi:proteasome accessory factor B
MADRLERLTNLVATLLDTRRPLPLEELVDVVPGYPPDKASYRRQFERDKDTLRGIGIPVQTEPLDALGPEVGYRIHPDEYYLPALALTAEEQAALHVAVTAVRLEGGAGPEALWKLGGLEGEAATAVAALPSVPELSVLFDAYRERAPVTFSYRDERRRLDPWGIIFRRGHWYVVGHDHDRADERAFRIDRVEGPVETGPSGTVERPEGVDPASLLRDDPWRFGDEEPVTARVLVDAPQAPGVVHQVGDHSVVERRADGSVVLGLPVTNVAAFRSFVVGLLDGAEVLDPPELRADVIGWLERLAAPR